MRIASCTFLAAMIAVATPRAALATTEICAPGAVATTGERADEVVQHCGIPSAQRHYPGARGRYGYRQPEDLWTYDLGEGTFPRVLHFIGGVLEDITLVSRWP